MIILVGALLILFFLRLILVGIAGLIGLLFGGLIWAFNAMVAMAALLLIGTLVLLFGKDENVK